MELFISCCQDKQMNVLLIIISVTYQHRSYIMQHATTRTSSGLTERVVLCLVCCPSNQQFSLSHFTSHETSGQISLTWRERELLISTVRSLSRLTSVSPNISGCCMSVIMRNASFCPTNWLHHLRLDRLLGRDRIHVKQIGRIEMEVGLSETSREDSFLEQVMVEASK